ncbi:MAG TPA: ferrochelatase [Sphingomicrobium sp.]|nr:ferrochelatase [Sphingomicrobium sp.]
MSATADGVGVLLINLGTPEAPTPEAVRRYLAEFLSDPRVVEIPSLIWQPILRGVILRTRPRKSAEAYRKIWSEAGSPLQYLTREQADDLRGRFNDQLIVDYAMRYGNPAIGQTMGAMMERGARRILVAPLYPQYCSATTATAADAVASELARLRAQPAIRTLPPYYADPLYIGALKASIERQLAALDFAPDRLLLSYHGMPERTRQLGDPYYDQCMETSRLLAGQLRLPVDVAFQSRFGRAKWLEPATDATLAAYPGQGVTKLAIAAPGFAADCLETLEELGIRGRETFLQAGGTRFARLDCLNSDDEGMDMLERLIRRELAGWWPAS